MHAFLLSSKLNSSNPGQETDMNKLDWSLEEKVSKQINRPVPKLTRIESEEEEEEEEVQRSEEESD